MRILFWSLSSSRKFCSVAQEGTLHFRYRVYPRKNSYVKLFQDLFGWGYFRAYEFVQRNPFLKNVDHKHITAAVGILNKLQVGVDEIRKCPRVLLILPVTIEHHFLLLRESGFSKVPPQFILTYTSLVKKNIRRLKVHRLLPDDANVSRNFLTALDAPEQVFQAVESAIDINSDDNTISTLRDTVLKSYLEWRLNASREEIEYMFSTYARVFNKSLQLVRRTLSIFLDDLHFPEKHIVKNGYLVSVHPVHLQKIIDNVPCLAGKPIRDVLYGHPLVAVANYENFTEILRVLRQKGIPEERILSNQNLFYLSGECVKERLPSLDPKLTSSEVKPFMEDDGKLIRVLINYENFNQRMNFLRCQHRSPSLPQVASLNILTGSQKCFEQFVKGLGGHNHGFDVVNYLVKSLGEVSGGDDLNITPANIRKSLHKNPNWRNVPVSEVMKCFEMLCQKNYKPKEILEALTILLYSPNIVEDNLKKLSSQPEILECFQLDGTLGNDFQFKGHNESNIKDIDHNVQPKPEKTALIHKYSLQLCLYFLDRDYHFSGDGIWFRK